MSVPDWWCLACHVRINGHKAKCHSCGTLAPSLSKPRDFDRKEAAARALAAEWICPARTCLVRNFGFRKTCFRCRLPKREGKGIPTF